MPSMVLPAQPAERECDRPASYPRRALALFYAWRQRLRDRRALALMDERSLRDLRATKRSTRCTSRSGGNKRSEHRDKSERCQLLTRLLDIAALFSRSRMLE